MATADRRRPSWPALAAPLALALLVVGIVISVTVAFRPRVWTPAGTAGVAGVVATVRYTPGFDLDVYAPNAGRRSHLPVVAMLHGCCGNRADLATLAEATAARGAVVLNIDWTGLRPGGYPVAYRQAACAVRVARALAPRFGGDPSRLGLLGWSDGAMIAAVVVEDGDSFRGRCLVTRGSSLPAALIGVAGFFGWPTDARDRVSRRAAAFFGGTPTEIPAAWAGGDPYAVVGRNRSLRTSLVIGATDPLRPLDEAFAARSRRTGRRVSFVVAPDSGDQSMIAPRTAEGRTTIREIFAALSART